MNSFISIVAGTLLVTLAAAVQAAPITQSRGGTNVSSAGSTFTHMLPPSETAQGQGQALLSLSFAASNNAAAQNDIISLFIGGSLQASGRAASFTVTDLDVSEFFDFATGTLAFQFFRGAPLGGGSIRLVHAELVVRPPVSIAATAFTREQPHGVAVQSSEPLTAPPTSRVQQIPEPGTLALFGISVLGMAMLRRRPV